MSQHNGMDSITWDCIRWVFLKTLINFIALNKKPPYKIERVTLRDEVHTLFT